MKICSLPSSVFKRWAMASTGVGSSGAGGASAKRSPRDGWWPSRAQCDQRRDPGGSAGRHIGRAEVAVVGQQGLRLAQILGQGGELVQHRRKLPLVVGSL